MTIKIGSLFPSHLNLNGDQGNVQVIAKQLAWRGLDCEVIAITDATQLSQLDFLLVGHGSNAAWASIQAGFEKICAALNDKKFESLPVLAVASGFERMKANGFFSELPESKQQARISKFAIGKFAGLEVLGYLNSESSLPSISAQGSWVGTLLHGPVLSRNPELLAMLLGAISRYSRQPIGEIKAKEKADQLADLVQKVWELERELANE